MLKILFIILLVVILSAVLTTDTQAAGIIWSYVCYGGTWIVIHGDFEDWSVWCGYFDYAAQTLYWYWGVGCEPAYQTKIVVQETPADNARAICRYRY